MTDPAKPDLDQQPKSYDDLKKKQALDTDREKPSSNPVDDNEPIDFSEHDNRLGGDPDVRRKASQSQSQSGQTQKQNTGEADV